MTCDPACPPRPSRARRALVATVAAAAVGAGPACATEADLSGPDLAVVGAGEFAATPAYLTAVADATDGLTYRISLDMTMRFAAEGESFQAGGTFATGEVDGDASSMTVDLGALFDEIADQMPADEALEGLLDGDLTMEMISDGTTAYMRLPYFRTVAEMMLDTGATRSDLGPLADLAELGDTWGRIDLSEVSPSEVASAAGGQTFDPGAFLDMAAQGTDVRELGTDTIDSVEVRGLGATVTYGDMLESRGMDADDLLDQMTSGAGVGGDDEFAEAFEQTMEAMMAADIPIEVWVDGDDRVRRISLALNMTEIMADVAEAAGEDVGDTGMSVDMVMDFTDYGDDSIQIEIPTDAVDITDEFLALMEAGGLDSGAGSPLGSI